MNRMHVRAATATDIAAFSDMTGKPTLKAWVGEVDGQIVGLAGFAFSHGRWYAFCDLREAARAHKVAIVRAGLMILAEARRMGIRYLYAEADPKEPGAVRWLTSLGFALDPRTTYLYRWSA